MPSEFYGRVAYPGKKTIALKIYERHRKKANGLDISYSEFARLAMDDYQPKK